MIDGDVQRHEYSKKLSKKLLKKSVMNFKSTENYTTSWP
jgi:hypothetical protein